MALKVIVEILHELAPEVDLDGVDRQANLADQFDLDSFGFLNLIELIHERTGVNVPESDYAELSTFEACTGYLAAHAL